MSFQHFRLGELAMGHPLPPHLIQQSIHQQSPQQQAPQQQHQQQQQIPHFHPQHSQGSIAPLNAASPTASASKQPYGSGDHDDGYTLVFPNLDAFHAWRAVEEETQMVEFVKGDTHGSKAIPPRFKDHTKLVCARHSRSGRKKYVKKHPDRVRKVPSRKLEGQGCAASISYKTYFGTDEVRACYMSHHSHEIGLANLPFTRRGRKAAVQQEKEKSKRYRNTSPVNPAPDGAAGPSNASAYNSAVSMLAPLPPGQSHHPFGQSSQFGQPLPQEDRWDRMSVLYNAIRAHARGGFDYPGPSVAALESVLIRLYLESPVGGVLVGVNGAGGGVPSHGGSQVMQGSAAENGDGMNGMGGVTSGD